ncbi:MAG: uroporphyrinogen decarboxylase family protein [Bacteroidota bacterium]|nr:uroporphyrinogen decarboxylase family protein [Bacteroidota bacterium]
MTDQQWDNLKAVIDGEILSPLPVGFIIDSPWLPNWYGMDILDYFSSDALWLEANLKTIADFPEAMFLPGFWAEYGMCSEPSAFGARSAFPQNEFPHAFPCIRSPEEIASLEIPDPVKDGLGPLMLNRLKLNQPAIEKAGHKIRFSVSRGPLNIASYLMGTTEFMMALMTHPEEAHHLIGKITEYLIGFHKHQADLFPSIDGIMMLDDIIGFISEDQFVEFGLPYFRRLYDTKQAVKFLHNDAGCMESVHYLPEMGVNLFNMGFDTDLNQLKELTNNRVTMLGNIPPRDVLARGSVAEVKNATLQLIKGLKDPSRVIFSCGGGMPPGVSSENLAIFIQTVKRYHP